MPTRLRALGTLWFPTLESYTCTLFVFTISPVGIWRRQRQQILRATVNVMRKWQTDCLFFHGWLANRGGCCQQATNGPVGPFLLPPADWSCTSLLGRRSSSGGGVALPPCIRAYYGVS